MMYIICCYCRIYQLYIKYVYYFKSVVKLHGYMVFENYCYFYLEKLYRPVLIIYKKNKEFVKNFFQQKNGNMKIYN